MLDISRFRDPRLQFAPTPEFQKQPRGTPLDKRQLNGLILTDREPRPSCHTIAWWLLEHYNAQMGECYPSYDLLAEECSLARSMVIEAVGLPASALTHGAGTGRFVLSS
jgi:hypothetical protein